MVTGSKPLRLYADFNYMLEKNVVGLNTTGTEDDLKHQGIKLANGLKVVLTDGEVEADGVVEYSKSKRIWVAHIDWDKARSVQE
jgi:hypothetical protein